MKSRSAAAAALLLVLVGGCSEHQISGQAKAAVTVDGKDQGQALTLRCRQAQSSWFLDIGDTGASANAIVDFVGDKVDVDAVTIRGLGGFDGGYWKGGSHRADATFANRKFTISGTANGLKKGVSGAVDATFKIVAYC